jgi:hypothetical protein
MASLAKWDSSTYTRCGFIKVENATKRQGELLAHGLFSKNLRIGNQTATNADSSLPSTTQTSLDGRPDLHIGATLQTKHLENLLNSLLDEIMFGFGQSEEEGVGQSLPCSQCSKECVFLLDKGSMQLQH